MRSKPSSKVLDYFFVLALGTSTIVLGLWLFKGIVPSSPSVALGVGAVATILELIDYIKKY